MKYECKRILAIVLSLCMVAGITVFSVTTYAEELDSVAIVAADKAALEVGFSVTDSVYGVTSDLTLPLTGISGSAITWLSDTPKIIAHDGAVTRPPAEAGDAEVTLTAAITYGEAEDTKEFPVTVLKEDEPQMPAAPAAMPSLGVGDLGDGVDLAALATPGNGIYYGACAHATELKDTDTGTVTAREDSPTPILWQVMGEENNDNCITLLSEYVLDSQKFNPGRQDAGYDRAKVQSYSDSAVHTWLNGIFMNSFAPAEQAQMAATDVITKMYDKDTGVEIIGDYYPKEANLGDRVIYDNDTKKWVNTGPWPQYVNAAKVYLPWGLRYGRFGYGSVYWTAGNNLEEGKFGSNYADNIATLKNGTVTTWLLRSAGSFNNITGHHVSRLPGTDPGVNIGAVGWIDVALGMMIGVRPAFKLTPSNIILASEIKSGADTGKGEIEADANYALNPRSGAKNFKLTLMDSALSLTGLTANGQMVDASTHPAVSTTPGGMVAVTGNGDSGARLTYKIVDSTRTMVGYGQGSDHQNLTINASNPSGVGLAKGAYTVYVWAQQNNELGSHTGSTPEYFTLTVNNSPPAAKDAVPTQQAVVSQYTQVEATFIAADIADDPDGEALTITAIVSPPDNAVATASLNAGGTVTVTGLAPGTTEVKVTVSDGIDSTDIAVPIRVYDEPLMPSVFPDSLTIYKGEIGTAYVFFGQNTDMASEANVTSSNPGIAAAAPTNLISADSVITIEGLSPGHTTITLGWKGGNYNGTTSTVQVEVQYRLHDIIIQTNGNGTANADKEKAIVGEIVTLSYSADSGYRFKEWQAVSGGVSISGNSFIMPDEPVTVKAVFEPIPAPTYTIAFNANGGTVSPAVMHTGTDGKLLSLPIPLRSNYRFDGWFTAASGGSAVTVDMGFNTNTTLYAHWIYTGGGSSGGRSTAPSGILVTSSGKNVADSGVSLSFPAGAVESDIFVQIRKAAMTSAMSLPDDSLLIGKVMDIVKNRSGDFAQPVTITMSFNKSQIDPEKYGIKICYFDEQNRKWVELDNINVDLASSTVSGEVDHFTKFAVIAVRQDEAQEKKFPALQPEIKLPADVAGHWAKESIAKLMQAGVIAGYPDGSFRPEKSVSRAEFTVMLVKALKLESKPGDLSFKDSADHWAKNSINAAAHGLISGYDRNSFGPDAPITREQAAVIIARAAGLEAGEQALSFSDARHISLWALSGAAAAVGKSYMSGYPDGSFRPQGNTTRAEAAAIIAKLL